MTVIGKLPKFQYSCQPLARFSDDFLISAKIKRSRSKKASQAAYGVLLLEHPIHVNPAAKHDYRQNKAKKEPEQLHKR